MRNKVLFCSVLFCLKIITFIIIYRIQLNIGTDQTASDQGKHCLPFYLYFRSIPALKNSTDFIFKYLSS